MSDIILRSDFDVELVQVNASDKMVSMAARVSTQGSDTRSRDDETGLINFLMRNRHGSPFEHGLFTWKISAPIFVWREFMRHRIASYNEQSGRYMELQPVFYAPSASRPLQQVGKPGAYEFMRGDETQTVTVARETRLAYAHAWQAYQRMLEAGVAKEVARIVLPVAVFSTAFVTMNPRGLMNFLSLRTKSELAANPSFPMFEIEKVAQLMEVGFRAQMPITWAAFNDNGRIQP